MTSRETPLRPEKSTDVSDVALPRLLPARKYVTVPRTHVSAECDPSPARPFPITATADVRALVIKVMVMRGAGYSFVVAVAGLLVSACGSVHPDVLDAAHPVVIDAGLDAPPPPPPSPAREILTGAGHVSGPTYRLDLTVGNGFDQRPMKGNTITAQGNSAIKP